MTYTSYRIIRMLVLVLVVAMLLHLPPKIARQDVVWKTYRALVEVDALARQHFIEPIAEPRLVDGAIRGMMLQLDPYSGYLSPAELQAFERRNRSHFVGIGAEIGARDGSLVVIAPHENGPAARAGLRPGDTILRIDGRDTAGLSVFDTEELLLGDPGTSIELLVKRNHVHDPVTVHVVRADVENLSVRGVRAGADSIDDFLLDGELPAAYLRISRFNEDTTAQATRAMRIIDEAGVRSLVLDLRFNPGGLIEQAVGVADLFLDGGLIVSTVTRNQVIRNFTAGTETPALGWSVVVLINGATASAAEVLAGALQDHGRAVLVGERSFGKGCVQRLIHLESLPAAIKLTYAYYRLPGGRIIHRGISPETTDWGIHPDVEVPAELPVADGKRGEEPLEGASFENLAVITASLPETSPEADNQLRAALAILRGQGQPEQNVKLSGR